MPRVLFYESNDGVQSASVAPNKLVNDETGQEVFVFKPEEVSSYIRHGFRFAQVEDLINRLNITGRYIIINTEDYPDLPRVRELRDAWILNGKKLDWDLEKAKEIALNLSLEALENALKPLDVPFLKAMESYLLTGDNSKAIEIAEKKKAIRAMRDELKQLNPMTIGDVQDSLNSLREKLSGL